MTRVSIVVPCFNGGSLVEEAVASAVGQSHNDIEVVVVDDGSTDPVTLEALSEVGALPGVRVVRQDNRGLPNARNRGIAESSGEYILPLDHDDEIHAGYAAMASQILDTDPHVGIVYARAERFGASAGEWHLLDFDMGRMLMGNLIFASALFRREDWQAVGGYSEALRRGYEDHDFWLKILGLGRRVVRLDEILFRYRDTEGSLVRAMTLQDRVDAYAYSFATNSALYVEHAPEFAGMILGQEEMLAHFKRRYGRVENSISRIGALRRRVLGKVHR